MPPLRDDHLFASGPKRILSLDGGGVRGLITLGMLAKVEALLRARSPNPKAFRLCDYFDLIGGTSTGALIASLLALGYEVADITRLYSEMAPRIFKKRRLFAGLQSKFNSGAFEKSVDRVLSDFLLKSGRDPRDVSVLRLNSELFRTGLALVTKRIDTASVWVLTNNSRAKYWDRNSLHWKAHHDAQDAPSFYPNSDYSLATIVRASASAPFYLDGVDLQISKDEFGHFLDGGASPFNNPAQELFLMTTLRQQGPGAAAVAGAGGVSPFGFNWETGASNLFMLSLGTGSWRNRVKSHEFGAKAAFLKAVHALQGIIDDADKSATTWMQAISVAPKRHRVDGSLLDMQDMRVVKEPLLTFCRVNPTLEKPGLAALGKEFANMPAEAIEQSRELDRADAANLARLLKIGLAAGDVLIADTDLPASFNLAGWTA